MAPGMTPRVADDEVRPRRLWYGVAGGVAGLGLAGAVVCLVLAAVSAGRVSDGIAEFRLSPQPVTPGVPSTVRLTPDTSWAVYVMVPRRTGPGGEDVAAPAPAVNCLGEGVDFLPYRGDLAVGHNGETYRPAVIARVAAAGTYEITCSVPGPDTFEHRLGVAEGIDADTVARVGGGILGAVAGVFGALALGLGGLLAGGLVALVVTLRRSSHRAALLARRHAAGPYPNGPYQGA
ncbi:MAG TPA: hypothetical protein VGD67_28130 [Pseudonocardiaceae bacterium]